MSASKTVLYEVVIAVARDIRDAYLDWLRPHMRKMLSLEGFVDASLYFDAEDDCVFTCAYRLRDRAALDAYLAGPAAVMRSDGVTRFGEKMSAKRRILVEMTV